MPRKMLTTGAREPGEDGAIQVELTLPVRQRRGEGGETRGQGFPPHKGSLPRIPRITRLMALAVKFQDMVDSGEVLDYADLARFGYVTRARLTQIMNLQLLAPDIQEMILFLPKLQDRRDKITEPMLRPICAEAAWDMQRRGWAHATRLRSNCR